MQFLKPACVSVQLLLIFLNFCFFNIFKLNMLIKLAYIKILITLFKYINEVKYFFQLCRM